MATSRPDSVSRAPWYFSCSTNPDAASFLSIPVTDAGATSSRSASADVVAASPLRPRA